MFGAITTGLTFFKAFKGPCLVLAGVALLAGLALGGWGMRAWYRDDVRDLELALANQKTERATDRAGLAEASRDAILEAGALYRAAEEGLRNSRDAAIAGLAADAVAAARSSANVVKGFKETIDANPDLRCLLLPLPDGLLERMRRPGEAPGAASDGDPGPAVRPSSSRVHADPSAAAAGGHEF